MRTLRNWICSAVLLAFFTLCSAEASAGIYLQFAGSNASGDVNGVGFSSAPWRLEFGIDETVPDSYPASTDGGFHDSILDGRIQINGILYELADGSSQGRLELSSYPHFRQLLYVLPDTGGVMVFLTGDSGIFPSLFSDHQALSTAVLGATVADNTTDPFNNSSRITFLGDVSLRAVGGELISIFEKSGPASGNFTVSVSDTSAFAPAEPSVVPEASSLVAWLLLGTVVAGTYWIRRRSFRKRTSQIE